MIWIVSIAFEKDMFGPDATSDTTTILGACFNGWSLSDSIDVRWGITGWEGLGIAGILSGASRMDISVRQAFCFARGILESYLYRGYNIYYAWMNVYSKDELSSCGDIVLSYLQEKYPELGTFKCDMMNYRLTCEKQMANHLRSILFRDVEEFLRRLDKEKASPSTFNNLGIVVVFYESLSLYIEMRGGNPFKGGR